MPDNLEFCQVARQPRAGGGFALIQVDLTECVLSGIAENAVSFSYRRRIVSRQGTPLGGHHAETFDRHPRRLDRVRDWVR